MAQQLRVVFNHGKESGPWGLKITELAQVAEQLGCAAVSLDYRGIMNPQQRLEYLLSQENFPAKRVLVGSSMGGWVAAMACQAMTPLGLFLMAPALYFPGWDAEPQAIPQHCSVVHGWHDEIVPSERAIRFASRHAAELMIVNSDHGLSSALPVLRERFAKLLESIQANQGLV